MSPLIQGPLAEALKNRRDNFNARFAAANRSGTRLDAAAFQQHIATILDPIIRNVAREFPERTDAVVEALFDLSLDLFRHCLLGPEAKYPAITEAWRTALPRLPAALLAREPVKLAGSLTNALYNLARTNGARPDAWLAALNTNVTTTEAFLDTAAVLAWRCGMPHYRDSALDKAAAMPAPLGAQALGLPASTSPHAIANTIAHLRSNPWSTPQAALSASAPELKIVAKAGAFRGFAGQFYTPPWIDTVDGEIIATDSGGAWRICADIYNTLLLRCEATSPQPPPLPSATKTRRASTADAEITRDGTVSWQGGRQRFPELADASGIAASAHTVAVTLPTSHHVFLLGLAE